jgi:hypothetical protein
MLLNGLMLKMVLFLFHYYLLKSLTEHFINWMDMETFSTFRKLWGRIEIDLEPKLYKFEIIDSKKFFIIFVYK